MHEVGLMTEVLDLAKAAAKKAGARRIDRVRLRIGHLAGVDPDALELAFQVASQDTLAEGAVLEIESVPTTCRCQVCEISFQPPDFVFACPGCGTLSSTVLAGREIELASLEVTG